MVSEQEKARRLARYREIRPQLRTGDIALFSSRTSFFSKVIRWATGSRWSHVGMVVHISEWDVTLLWESNTSNKFSDVSDGIGKCGVQLLVLSEVLREYDGTIAFRHLDVSDDVRSGFVPKLRELREEVRNRPYEKDFFSLASVPFQFLYRWKKKDLASLFCSELVAEAYLRMGLITEARASSAFAPGDFGNPPPEGRAALSLALGALGPEIPL
ncbi:MAG: hypothetical protein R3F11_09765 [Verrucomicrobiales bacterium]